MKKYIALLSACIMAVSVCGCSDESSNDNNADEYSVSDTYATDNFDDTFTRDGITFPISSEWRRGASGSTVKFTLESGHVLEFYDVGTSLVKGEKRIDFDQISESEVTWYILEDRPDDYIYQGDFTNGRFSWVLNDGSESEHENIMVPMMQQLSVYVPPTEPLTEAPTEPPTEPPTEFTLLAQKYATLDKVYNGKYVSFPVCANWELEKDTIDADGTLESVTYKYTGFDYETFMITFWCYEVDNHHESRLAFCQSEVTSNHEEGTTYSIVGEEGNEWVYEQTEYTPYFYTYLPEYDIVYVIDFESMNDEIGVELLTEITKQFQFKEVIPPAQLEAEYKEKCQSIPWKDIARDAEGLPGEYVTFTGQIVQDCGDGFYRMATQKYTYIDGYHDDIILVYYDIGDGDRILEDDIITIWGETTGLYTYETVMGDTQTIPSVAAEYYELIE